MSYAGKAIGGTAGVVITGILFAVALWKCERGAKFFSDYDHGHTEEELDNIRHLGRKIGPQVKNEKLLIEPTDQEKQLAAQILAKVQAAYPLPEGSEMAAFQSWLGIDGSLSPENSQEPPAINYLRAAANLYGERKANPQLAAPSLSDFKKYQLHQTLLAWGVGQKALAEGNIYGFWEVAQELNKIDPHFFPESAPDFQEFISAVDKQAQRNFEEQRRPLMRHIISPTPTAQ